MTESDYIIQHLRMDLDRAKIKERELETKIHNLEEALKIEWNCDKIEYCTRCGSPMPEAAYADEANEYCDICADDMMR